MKICKFCNQENAPDAITCTSCGANIETQNIVAPEKKPSLILKLLSFCFPLVGIVLYFANRNTDKRAAKSYGKMALISIIIGVVFSIIFFIIGMVAARSAIDLASDDSSNSGYVDVADDVDDDFSIEIDNEDDDFSISLDDVENYNTGDNIKDDFNIPAIGE